MSNTVTASTDKNELSALAVKDEINAHHREAIRAGNDTIKYALAAGELLHQVKGLVPHGQFQKWVEQFCDFSYDVANGYMQLKTRIERLPKMERAPLLTTAKSVTSLQNMLKPKENCKPKSRKSPPSGFSVSAKPPDPEVVDDDENDGEDAGDELTEAAETAVQTPAKAGSPPPVSGPDCKALFREWEKAIGPLCRTLDRIAGAMGQKNGVSHRTIHDHLDVCTDEMIEWLGVKK